MDTPQDKQRSMYMIYRTMVLSPEADIKDKKRYVQWLVALPIRVEFTWIRYRALNLMRESETLASLDRYSRFEIIDKDYLISANQKIVDSGLKFPHLALPGTQLATLPAREVWFVMRQTYLSYLKSEATLLSASPIAKDSPMLARELDAIQKNLAWATNDRSYIDVPRVHPLIEVLLRAFPPKRPELAPTAQ
jgi:hypothetical protein